MFLFRAHFSAIYKKRALPPKSGIFHSSQLGIFHQKNFQYTSVEGFLLDIHNRILKWLNLIDVCTSNELSIC